MCLLCFQKHWKREKFPAHTGKFLGSSNFFSFHGTLTKCFSSLPHWSPIYFWWFWVNKINWAKIHMVSYNKMPCLRGKWLQVNRRETLECQWQSNALVPSSTFLMANPVDVASSRTQPKQATWTPESDLAELLKHILITLKGFCVSIL